MVKRAPRLCRATPNVRLHAFLRWLLSFFLVFFRPRWPPFRETFVHGRPSVSREAQSTPDFTLECVLSAVPFDEAATDVGVVLNIQRGVDKRCREFGHGLAVRAILRC